MTDAAVFIGWTLDRSGIVESFTDGFTAAGVSIDVFDAHTEDRCFIFRVEASGRDCAAALHDAAARAEISAYTVDALHPAPTPVVLAVSRAEHCAVEVLADAARGALPIEVVAVLANHPDVGATAERFGVPFAWHPSGDDHADWFAERLEAIAPDLVVLARYMQIVPPATVARWSGRMLNIHHSLLPAFVGANPYRQAFDRGVKVVGATAHYVTDILDDGPIVAQDVVRVSHRDDVARLTRHGEQVEAKVLVDAIRAHVEHRVVVRNGRTVVFDR